MKNKAQKKAALNISETALVLHDLSREAVLSAMEDEEGPVFQELTRVTCLIADTFADGKDPDKELALQSPLCQLALEVCMGVGSE